MLHARIALYESFGQGGRMKNDRHSFLVFMIPFPFRALIVRTISTVLASRDLGHAMYHSGSTRHLTFHLQPRNVFQPVILIWFFGSFV